MKSRQSAPLIRAQSAPVSEEGVVKLEEKKSNNNKCEIKDNLSDLHLLLKFLAALSAETVTSNNKKLGMMSETVKPS